MSAVTIGTYDGVHLGHGVILSRVKALARELGGESVVLSFDPHPRRVIGAEGPPVALLTTTDEKVERLQSAGMDRVVLYPFTRRFSELDAQTYLREVVAERLRPTVVVVGYDHRFGHDRSGGLDALRAGGERYGFRVEEIPAQEIDAAKVSSSRIRAALLRGEVVEAERLLGYAYRLSGTVVHGRQLGRTIGYPTANLQPTDPDKLVPALGVYAVRCHLPGGTHYPGMLSIGTNPTVAPGLAPTVEVYLMGFSGDLYGSALTLEFRAFLRPEAKFDSLEALRRQMDHDRQAALQVLA